MDKDERLFNRVHRLLIADRTVRAADILNKILDDPGLSDRWLKTALDLGFRGNYARADDYLMVLYCIGHGDPEIILIKAMNTWLQGQNKAAAAMCCDLIKEHPDFTGAYITLADAQYGMCQYKEALCSYDLFLESEPGNISAWCGKGLTLRGLGREEEARDCFVKALELEPGCARRYLNTARHHASYELYGEALISLEMAVALDPDLKKAWFERGIALLKTGKFQEALSCMDKVEGDDSLAIQVLAGHCGVYRQGCRSPAGPAVQADCCQHRAGHCHAGLAGHNPRAPVIARIWHCGRPLTCWQYNRACYSPPAVCGLRLSVHWNAAGNAAGACALRTCRTCRRLCSRVFIVSPIHSMRPGITAPTRIYSTATCRTILAWPVSVTIARIQRI